MYQREAYAMSDLVEKMQNGITTLDYPRHRPKLGIIHMVENVVFYR